MELRHPEGAGLFAAEPLGVNEAEKGSKTGERPRPDALVPQPAKTECLSKGDEEVLPTLSGYSLDASSQKKEDLSFIEPEAGLSGESYLYQERDFSRDLQTKSKTDSRATDALSLTSKDDLLESPKGDFTSYGSISCFSPSQSPMAIPGTTKSAFSSETLPGVLHIPEPEDSNKIIPSSTEIAQSLSTDQGVDQDQTKKQEEEFAVLATQASKPMTEQTPTRKVPFWEEEKDMTEDESDEEGYTVPSRQKSKALEDHIYATHDQQTIFLDKELMGKETESKTSFDTIRGGGGGERLESMGSLVIEDVKKEEEPSNKISGDRFSHELFPDKVKEQFDRGILSATIEKNPFEPSEEPLQEKELGMVFPVSDSSTCKMQIEEDRSGMSKYFETSTLKDDAIKGEVLQPGSDYYELSDTKGQVYDPYYHKDFLMAKKEAGECQSEDYQAPTVPARELGYSTLAQGFPDDEPSSPTERLYTIDPNVYGDKRELHSKNKDDLTLSRSLGLGGRSAIEQRSMSINLPMSCLDSIALGFNFARGHDLSPLGSDILDNASGDEGHDYLPATTPSVEKVSTFPIDSREEDNKAEELAVKEEADIQVEPLGESPLLAKDYYKNGTIMAPDLPEMLDLAGTRSRLASMSTDAEATASKAISSEGVVEDSRLIQHLLADENHMTLKADSQLEDLGYCVFNKYTVPMPSPVQDSENLAGESCPFDEKMRRNMVTDLSLIEVKLAAAERSKAERETDDDSAVLGKEFEQERKAIDKLDTVLEKSEEQTEFRMRYSSEDTEYERITLESISNKNLVGLEEGVSSLGEKGKAKVEISCKPDYNAIKHDMESAARKVEQENQSKLGVHSGAFVSEQGAEDQESSPQEPSIYAKTEPSHVKDAAKLTDMEVKEKGPKPDLVHQEAVDKEESYESSGDNDQAQEGLPLEPSKEYERKTELESPSLSEEELVSQLLVGQPTVERNTSKMTQEGTAGIQMENIPPLKDDNVELLQSVVSVKTEAALPCDLSYEKVRGDEEEQQEPEKEKQREEKESTYANEVRETDKPGEEEEELRKAVPQEMPELKGIIESVVTIEDDFITVVQTTVDEGDAASHSVRFADTPADETEEDGFHPDDELEVEIEAAVQAETKEDDLEAPSSPEKEEIPVTDYKTETYDDYKDETTMDDSILDTDSIWVDTQGVPYPFLAFCFCLFVLLPFHNSLNY